MNILSVWESIEMTHLCAAKMHSTPDQNTKWSYVQCRFVVLDAMGVDLFFLARTVSGSGTPGCFYTVLPPSPSDLGGPDLGGKFF